MLTKENVRPPYAMNALESADYHFGIMSPQKETVETFLHAVDSYINEVTSRGVGRILVKWMLEHTQVVRDIAKVMEGERSSMASAALLYRLCDHMTRFEATEDIQEANHLLDEMNLDLKLEGIVAD